MSEVSRLNAMKNAIQKPFWLSHHLLWLEQKNKKQMLIQIQTTLWLVFCLLVKLAVIHREKKGSISNDVIMQQIASLVQAPNPNLSDLDS